MRLTLPDTPSRTSSVSAKGPSVTTGGAMASERAVRARRGSSSADEPDHDPAPGQLLGSQGVVVEVGRDVIRLPGCQLPADDSGKEK